MPSLRLAAGGKSTEHIAQFSKETECKTHFLTVEMSVAASIPKHKIQRDNKNQRVDTPRDHGSAPYNDTHIRTRGDICLYHIICVVKALFNLY